MGWSSRALDIRVGEGREMVGFRSVVARVVAASRASRHGIACEEPHVWRRRLVPLR